MIGATMSDDPTYTRMVERYRSGNVPWDQPLPPPEILEVVPKLDPGRALDLGCGYGRSSIYLALNDWYVDAIDFIPEAIKEARKRADEVGAEVRFHLHEVDDLSFLKGEYDLAIDVGCSHNMTVPQLIHYSNDLSKLLRDGAIFLLYARLCIDNSEPVQDGPKGLREETINDVFRQYFDLNWKRLGETIVEDQSPWPSGWFKFQRR